MNNELSKLYPHKMWEIFANICAIPHPSKHEEKILAWLKDWAKEHNIAYDQDETGNMVLRKPATPGYENRVPIIFQGHIDMVPQANSDSKHNFVTDPILPRICDDGWVRATGTTLGADNGMGCAAAMAILIDKNIEHGPIEVLVTVDEETGMTGAFGLKPGFIKGNILINLDSEDEGELYVGCAGGLDANFELDYNLQATPADMKGYEIAVTGLKGGHSGMDIILGRANANKVAMRLLKKGLENFDIHIANINGGSLRNAIPREAFVTLAAPANKTADFEKLMNGLIADIAKEFSGTEPDFKVELKPIETPKQVMCKKCQEKVVNLVLATPNGVVRMSDSMPGLVETSTNLAIVKTENGVLSVANLMRSSVESAKEALADDMRAIAELAGARIELRGGYPGWKPNLQSPILKTMMKVYENMYGKTPEIKAIHAGLECGLFSLAYPNWDMISCGPTIRSPHSPDERVNIESVGKFWDFLVETVKNIPVK
ncbi:MAG: aminoacyl-histidine dipeptidase [Bacteroidetes bacterium]|nr:aminoacyl-histidine dipeptidase [Bacteroidota bacterium]MCL2301854.1 aminoacyl-histidine dipeptidase [Lentimicrobiaceae bacterium]